MRADSMMPLTRQTVWSPASWSADGTRHCRRLPRVEREIAALIARRPPPLGEPER